MCSRNCKKIKQKTRCYCAFLQYFESGYSQVFAPYFPDNFKIFQENTPDEIHSQESRRFSANQTLPRVVPQYFCGIFRIAGSKNTSEKLIRYHAN